MKRLLLGFVAVVTLTGCGVSAQQEMEMGAQTAQEINSQIPLVRDPEINRYINVLGDSLARVADNRGIDYTFYVVDAPEVNAFAVPGGYVYVNRGLIERTRNMSQLAGVLGHEIGHVVLRHSVQQMEQMQQAQVGVTLACILTSICQSQAGQAAINVGGTALFAKFSRDDEREADQQAVTTTVRAGINPNGIPEMFEILLAERSRNPGAVDSWFSTHPLEEDRIAQTRAMISKIDPAVLRTLTTDTQAYQTFKRRVQALPPSPRTR